MKTEAFSIRFQNLHFVPVVRHQLSFAVCVRSAFFELARDRPWTDEDLVAIALPMSIGKESERILSGQKEGCLPVTLLYASWGAVAPREVFAISPTDAFAEAMRLAIEHHVSLSYIDSEISPDDFSLRRCADHPFYPDSTLVLEPLIGCKGYIELIRQLCAEPPVRFEPTDTWREQFLAANLRRLHRNYRRVLVICEAQHYLALPKLIVTATGAPSVSRAVVSPDKIYEIDKPTTHALLQYLGEFPRLTEEFQRSRSKSNAVFQPYQELLNLVWRFGYADLDDKPSSRRVKVFAEYLRRLTLSRRRVMPNPSDLGEVCRSCLGDDIASKVIYRLGEYQDQLTLERIKIRKGVMKGTFVVKPQPVMRGVVSRSCGGETSGYVPEPRPKPPPKRRPKSKSLTVQRSIWDDMRSKAAYIAASREREAQTREFRGAIEGGIDVRRTLRASQNVVPKVYVVSRRLKRTNIDYKHEPIVWLLRPDVEAGLECTQSEQMSISVPSQSRAVDPQEKIPFRAQDGSFRLRMQKVYGVLDLEGVWKAPVPANEMKSRLKKWDHGAYFHQTEAGCVFHELETCAGDLSWPEILMRTAVLAARRGVMVVKPEDYNIPASVWPFAAHCGVKIIPIALSSFSSVERAKLSFTLSVELTVPVDLVRSRIFATVSKLGLG